MQTRSTSVGRSVLRSAGFDYAKISTEDDSLVRWGAQTIAHLAANACVPSVVAASSDRDELQQFVCRASFNALGDVVGNGTCDSFPNGKIYKAFEPYVAPAANWRFEISNLRKTIAGTAFVLKLQI